MSQKANRQASKEWAELREQQEREERFRQNVMADLAQLDRFRQYFLRERKVWQVEPKTLISLIDDYAERLTGDRTALHSGTSEKPKPRPNMDLLK